MKTHGAFLLSLIFFAGQATQAQDFTATLVPGEDGGGARTGTGLVSLSLSGQDLTITGTFNGVVTLVDGTGGFTLAEQIDQLKTDQWYINIHSTTFGGITKSLSETASIPRVWITRRGSS